ncbi:MAG: UDP-N-acetylmuramate dehydrogenase [Methylococcales symbiont of Iophon sp. n. MRB-2018]|nr:MAG: UDP-N-acetylmuramate dehydrogenase [Methylococcales symbiont of Iophon sp. n. MRB-2018]KAF3979394.1 MAG: UDP-N-acetylmuramate dehydrogenase [Methylococcales symbiont of Iophon sp. n. MRB-2018]
MSGVLLKNELLAKYTGWRVGGPAKQMYLPEGKEDLIRFISALPKQEKLFWLGLGSNLLVRDGGIEGTVINTRGHLKTIQYMDKEQIYVEAGVPCAHVARYSAEKGLAGAEFLAGIPGTMGGALKMNAGAFGSETWDIVESVEMINAQGQVTDRMVDQFEVAYRSVKGYRKEWFLAVLLKLKKGESGKSQQQIKAFLEKRARTQPTNKPTCGSVFKNPEGDYAARLIESSGLKGYQLGGACVSLKHANFIENTGNASAADIENLIEYMQQKIFKEHHIRLETEVCCVGVAL